jgi:DNA-binding transcriptional ArsR family regulator
MDFFIRLIKALSNETRLEIVQYLVKNKQLSLEEIVTRINRPYKTIAGHLKILEKSGLLRSRRHKGEVLYTLNTPAGMYYNRMLVELVKKRMDEK